MNLEEIISRLRASSRKDALPFLKKFGIETKNALGVSIPNLRKLAKEVGKDHSLAQQLWDTEIHDARILASMIDEPDKVTKMQFDTWSKDFNSWDLCDQTCQNLFNKVAFAKEKALQYTSRSHEFQKRAGFVIMAVGAVHWKSEEDKLFEEFFPVIEREAHDERNFVKKGVNWALRQIGKRNDYLRKKAIQSAKRILSNADNKAANWIAKDALRELER